MNSNGAIQNCKCVSGGIFPVNLHSRMKLYLKIIIFWHVILHSKRKVIPVQAVEDLRIARGSGSHIIRHSVHSWRPGCQP
jgi:hypothetical protein